MPASRTFIRAVSAATPKVADYPFTTLYPNLGVVSVEPYRSFVIADIPGLIEGAADGAGLGSLFLRHVQRTRVLLHLVDMAPFDEAIDPVEQVRAIENELRKYDPGMLEKPRWLVLNKADLLSEDEAPGARRGDRRGARTGRSRGSWCRRIEPRRHLADHAARSSSSSTTRSATQLEAARRRRGACRDGPRCLSRRARLPRRSKLAAAVARQQKSRPGPAFSYARSATRIRRP